jgi:hypothetical protein
MFVIRCKFSSHTEKIKIHFLCDIGALLFKTHIFFLLFCLPCKREAEKITTDEKIEVPFSLKALAN